MNRPIALLLAVGLMACTSGGTMAENRVPTGSWGGEHVRLTVSDPGGTVEFDCAHGTLDAPLKVDTEGRFDVPGSLVREGGPATPGGESDRQSVRYSGRVNGSSMDLDLRREAGEALGSFRLKMGERGKLLKCL